MMDTILISQTIIGWVDTVADRITQAARLSIEERGRFSLALSGGSTPRLIYQRLSSADYKKQINWEKTYLFWGDERCVPPEHPESNFNMAKTNLIDHVSIPPINIFRIQGELPPKLAARKYSEDLAVFFNSSLPQFDLVLLGLGDDGHIASLFPNSSALHENHSWVVENFKPSSDSWRITLTLPVINNARNIYVLVTGPNKADIIKEVIEHPNLTPDYPAKRIAPHKGELIWLLDSQAAMLLKSDIPGENF